MKTNHEDINDSYCQCSVCTAKKLQAVNINSNQSHMGVQNSMVSFLELLPRNFPLCIVPTASPKTKAFYFNRFGNRFMISPFSKITEHFPLATNIVLFYQSKELVAHKYELIKEDPNFLYIQAHNPQVPLTFQYRPDQNFMDVVLSQKFTSLLKNMSKSQNYDLSNSQRDFLTWVHKDYNDIIFCKYMTKLYCGLLEIVRRDLVKSAKFQWIIEKPGVIKLSNVKDLVVEKKERCATFQEQYQQKILEKLNSKQSIQTKLFNSFVKKSKINYRVNNFRNEIRDIFNQQKLKILKNTQKQRTVETKSLSDDVARLFLPQLHKYTSLRQVLNDETKFKKVVLGIQVGPQVKKQQRGFRRAREQSQLIQRNRPRGRHYRSKTQIYDKI